LGQQSFSEQKGGSAVVQKSIGLQEINEFAVGEQFTEQCCFAGFSWTPQKGRLCGRKVNFQGSGYFTHFTTYSEIV